ncbi:MAG TPA: hypothetical protein DEO84_06200 [candidate division Zixibacteria bacterium]|nr:hypothetical protein [candidate division Zixibacteria bacterium]
MKMVRVTISLILLAISFALAGEPMEQSGTLSSISEGKTIFVIHGSRNLNGNIKIIPHEGNQIEISYRKWAEAESPSQARQFLDLIDLRIISSDDRTTLNILTPSDSPWEGSNYHVSLEIVVQLPEKMQIEGQLQFMKLEVRGPFNGVSVKSGFSELDISDISGPIEIATSFAQITLADITGSVKAETRYGLIRASDINVPLGSAIFKNTGGGITLSDIQGPVEAYTSYSPIEAQDITADEGSVVFRTSYSPINLSDISGEIICETSFSPIKIINCSLTHGQSRIETSFSPINAELSTADESELFIYNNYNNINLSIPSGISTQIAASVDQGGRIHTSRLPVKPSFLDATRLEGKLGNGNGRIELKVSGIGAIEIEGR